MDLVGTELMDLHAEIDREVGGAAEHQALAIRWLGDGLTRLAGEWRAQIDAGPPLSDVGVRQDGAPTGPPGSPWASMWVQRRGRRTGWVYSAANWAAFEQALSKPPDRAEVRITILDRSGVPSRSSVGLTVRRPDDAPGWVVLSADAPAEDFADPGRGDQLQARWLGFVRAVADDVDPAWGQITDDFRGPGTPLDTVLRRLADESVASSRTVLRGYSWVTICAKELAERLGGVEALRATGAFHMVAPLRAGGLWLQATERYQDYGPAQIDAVFRALAPVLPPGRPAKPPPFVPVTYRLVYEDASTVSR